MTAPFLQDSVSTWTGTHAAGCLAITDRSRNMACLQCSTCQRFPDLQGRLSWGQRLTTSGLSDDRVQPMLGTLSVHSREKGVATEQLVQPGQGLVELAECGPGCLGQLIERSRGCRRLGVGQLGCALLGMPGLQLPASRWAPAG